MLDEQAVAPVPLCEGFAPPPSVVDRNYHTRYIRLPARPSTSATTQQPQASSATSELHDDFYIHFHNNGIAVIGLADSHPIIACKLKLANVEWSASAAPLLTTRLVGKRKHGSLTVQPHSDIATLTTLDGQRFVVRAAVRGHLIEVNERLMDTRPGGDSTGSSRSSGVLERDSEWSGYVGVVLMDKPQLYDLIDNKDGRYATAQAWKERMTSTHASSTDAR